MSDPPGLWRKLTYASECGSESKKSKVQSASAQVNLSSAVKDQYCQSPQYI